MVHQCNCHTGIASAKGHVSLGSPIHAAQRVGEVADTVPGALEVMQSLGIDQCCGRDLTLAEAAGLAGVSLDDLLDALRAARTGAP